MYWHDGFKESDTDWEEIQVPDGSDWIEYMLNIPPTADHKELGVQNHFSLGVPSSKAAIDLIHARGLDCCENTSLVSQVGCANIARNSRTRHHAQQPPSKRSRCLKGGLTVYVARLQTNRP